MMVIECRYIDFTWVYPYEDFLTLRVWDSRRASTAHNNIMRCSERVRPGQSARGPGDLFIAKDGRPADTKT